MACLDGCSCPGQGSLLGRQPLLAGLADPAAHVKQRRAARGTPHSNTPPHPGPTSDPQHQDVCRQVPVGRYGGGVGPAGGARGPHDPHGRHRGRRALAGGSRSMQPTMVGRLAGLGRGNRGPHGRAPPAGGPGWPAGGTGGPAGRPRRAGGGCWGGRRAAGRPERPPPPPARPHAGPLHHAGHRLGTVPTLPGGHPRPGDLFKTETRRLPMRQATPGTVCLSVAPPAQAGARCLSCQRAARVRTPRAPCSCCPAAEPQGQARLRNRWRRHGRGGRLLRAHRRPAVRAGGDCQLLAAGGMAEGWAAHARRLLVPGAPACATAERALAHRRPCLARALPLAPRPRPPDSRSAGRSSSPA